jgi:hypothetical protein
MARRRAQWLHYLHRIDPSRLIFIGETPAFAGTGSGRRPIWSRCEAGRRAARG